MSLVVGRRSIAISKSSMDPALSVGLRQCEGPGLEDGSSTGLPLESSSTAVIMGVMGDNGG